jgi:predicted RNA binding protein YcfA (HicA-like mRNA interferase family)
VKTPRDLSWRDVVAALSRYGYAVVRQTGSHIRLATMQNGEHHVTVPAHDPIRVGTLNAIITECAVHFRKTSLK